MSKYLKATDKVQLTLGMTVKDARMLRDELVCVMRDLGYGGNRISDEYACTLDGSKVDIGENFPHYYARLKRMEYAYKMMPVLDKLYQALRLCLRLEEKDILLDGDYAPRRSVEMKNNTREIYAEWVELMLNQLPETLLSGYSYRRSFDLNHQKEALAKFHESTRIHCRLFTPQEGKFGGYDFGYLNDQEESGVAWFPAYRTDDHKIWQGVKKSVAEQLLAEWDASPPSEMNLAIDGDDIDCI